MKDGKWMVKEHKWILFGLALVMAALFLLTAGDGETSAGQEENGESGTTVNMEEKGETAPDSVAEEEEKGYQLPVSEKEQKEATVELQKSMERVKEIYLNAEKGEAQNAVISKDTAKAMMEVLGEEGLAVSPGSFWLNMENGEKLDVFLKNALQEKQGEVTVYEIHTDGSLGRKKFFYDGKTMYEIYAGAFWKEEGSYAVSTVSRTRIQDWNYTGKGWFLFEVCVPEWPEVTEVVNGREMIRVKKQEERILELEETWLLPLGYRGNSLLSVSWREGELGEVNPGRAFSGLYAVEYGQAPRVEQYPEGVPSGEFEALLTKYLPVTVQELRQWADYREDTETYAVDLLGYGAAPPGALETSVPEITEIRKNPDGTVTLKTDAVCEMAGLDRAMEHQVTVQFTGDGLRYLANQVKEK